MHLITALKKYGLSESEAKVYLALLKLIEASVYQIATKSELPRTTVYYILKKLKDKGLILHFRKRNVQFFTPEPPQALLDHLRKKEQVIQEILPKLHSLSEDKEIKPEVSLFFGKEGIKKVYNDILKTLRQEKIKHLLTISQPELFKLLPRFFPQWVQKRQKLGVFSYIIFPDTKEAHKIDALYSGILMGEIRFLPREYNWLGTFNVYSNKIALFSLSQNELSAMIIENQTLANMMKNFFQFNWEMLAKKQKFKP